MKATPSPTLSVTMALTLMRAPSGPDTQTSLPSRMFRLLASRGFTSMNMSCCSSASQGFIEVNPRDANNLNIRDGNDVWVSGPEGARIRVKAMVTERVGEGVAFMPFHFGGHLERSEERRVGKECRCRWWPYR